MSEHDGFDPTAIRDAYAAIADEYVATFGDDLEQLDLDRRLLDQMAEHAAGVGPVLDIGCGPAQAGRYLTARRVDVVGIDLASAMLAIARNRDARIAPVVADLRSLPLRSATAAGAVAFYVLQHLPRSGLPAALHELRRVLASGGLLLVAAHAGSGELQPAPDINATRYTAAEVEARLAGASFVVESVHAREPLPHEHQGARIYVVARAA